MIENIKRLVRASGMPQGHIEVQAGLPLNRLSKWFSGQGEPSVSQALRIATVLGVSFEELAGELAGKLVGPTNPLERRVWDIVREIGPDEAWRRLIGSTARPRSGPERHSTVFGLPDLQASLDDLRVLKDGWLDGEWAAPDSAGLDWLEAMTRENYSGEMPSPRVFPTPNGRISFEWHDADHVASLTIDLARRVGNWLAVNIRTHADETTQLNLDQPSGWEELGRLLGSLKEGVDA